MIKIIMKIPLIENDSWVYDWIVDGKEEYPQTVYIDLNDSRAVEMAIENVEFQAADDYFDALFEVWINDKLFFENHTTDAYMTWRGFLNAMEEKGKHNVVFLDDPIDLIIHHFENYEFIFDELEYEFDEKDILRNVKRTTISSGLLQKEEVETAIKDGFVQYAEFILKNNIPISKKYKKYIERELKNLSKNN